MPEETSPQDQLSAVMRKVKRLRALARSTNRHEAMAAAAAADALMTKYRIDEATLRDAATGRDSTPLVTWKKRRPEWQVKLADVLCLHYDVAYYWWDVGPEAAPTSRSVIMCGAEADVAMVRSMWRWLKSEAMRLGKNELPPTRSIYRFGLVLGIAQVLAAVKREALRKAPANVAIVLRNRYESARKKMYDEGPKMHEGSLDLKTPHELGKKRVEAISRGYVEGLKVDVEHAKHPAKEESHGDNVVRGVDFKKRRRGPFSKPRQ